MAVAMIGPKFYAWDRNGKPLAFGKLYTYETRTNVPKATYQSEDQVVENENPVIFNGEGYANVYLSGSYKMVLKDSDENEIWSSDPVSSNGSQEWINCQSAEYVSPSEFKIVGNVTDSYDAGRGVRIDESGSVYKYASIKTSIFAAGYTTVELYSPVVTTGISKVCASIVGKNATGLISDERYTSTFSSVENLKLGLTNDNGQITEQQITAKDIPAKTLGYYDGWAAMIVPQGSASYLLTTVQRVRDAKGDAYWVPDGFVDHYLYGGSTYVAVYNGSSKLSLKQAGAKPDSSIDSYSNIFAAINYCKSNKIEMIIDGFFGSSQTLFVYSAAKWTGLGAGNSGIFNIGADDTFVLAGEGGESGTYDVNLRDFRVSSRDSTHFAKNLFDMTGFRYGSMDNIKLIIGRIGARITSSWGMTFTNCTFNCGGNVTAGMLPAGTIGIDSPTGLVESVMNLSTFVGCEISGNKIGVNAVSLGRNVLFVGCGFEANGVAFKCVGNGVSLGITIKNCYWEGNEDDCVLIDNSIADRSDHIKLIDNYVVPAATANSLFVRMSGTSSSTVTLEVIDTELEVFNGRGPTNNYIIYTPDGTGVARINYQHHKPPTIAQPDYVVKHWLKDSVNYATMSSNLPVLLDYEPGWDGTSIFDALKVYIDNGKAEIVGNAVNAANVVTGQQNIATIPQNLLPLVSGTTITGVQFNSTSTDNTYCTVALVGGKVRAAFPSPSKRMEISGTWFTKSGPYLGFVS